MLPCLFNGLVFHKSFKDTDACLSIVVSRVLEEDTFANNIFFVWVVLLCSGGLRLLMFFAQTRSKLVGTQLKSNVPCAKTEFAGRAGRFALVFVSYVAGLFDAPADRSCCCF